MLYFQDGTYTYWSDTGQSVSVCSYTLTCGTPTDGPRSAGGVWFQVTTDGTATSLAVGLSGALKCRSYEGTRLSVAWPDV